MYLSGTGPNFQILISVRSDNTRPWRGDPGIVSERSHVNNEKQSFKVEAPATEKTFGGLRNANALLRKSLPGLRAESPYNWNRIHVPSTSYIAQTESGMRTAVSVVVSSAIAPHSVGVLAEEFTRPKLMEIQGHMGKARVAINQMHGPATVQAFVSCASCVYYTLTH